MSSILERWCAGEGLPGVTVVDCHTHVGATDACIPPTPDDAARVVLRQMDAHGVDAAINLGRAAYVGGDYRRVNDETLWIHQHYPRLIGFCHVNPWDRVINILNELERTYKAGLRGIKLIHHYQEEYPATGPMLMPVYQYAAERGMVILNHDWQKEEYLRQIAAQFPTVDLIIGHYTQRWDSTLRDCRNVYACTWRFCFPREMEHAVRAVGAAKLLFGTDSYLNPFAFGLGPILYARVSDEDKRKILGLNMMRLLAKVGGLPDVSELLPSTG